MKKERLITEIASGVKMLELGLPARLSKDSLSMVDYWTRELKEDPCLIDAIESEVNGALKVLKKAELGERWSMPPTSISERRRRYRCSCPTTTS